MTIKNPYHVIIGTTKWFLIIVRNIPDWIIITTIIFLIVLILRWGIKNSKFK